MSRFMTAGRAPRIASRAWLRRATAPLFVALLVLAVSPARAGLLDKLLHPQGDSGSGKVARLAFRLDDRSFYPIKVVWSPDGRLIATAGNAVLAVHIWDVAQRKLVKVLQLYTPTTNQYAPIMAWSPDGRYLAACNAAFHSLFSVRIYATKDWSVVKDLGPRDGAIGCAMPTFSSDGQELTVWGGNLTTFATSDWHVIRQFKGWKLEGDKAVGIPHPWNQYLLLHDMSYVPGTHTLVFGAGEFTKGRGMCEPTPAPFSPFAGLVYVVKPGDIALPRPLVVYCRPHGTDVLQLAVNPDGKTVVTVTGADEKASDNGVVVTNEPGNNTKVIRLVDGKDVTPPLTWLSNNVPGGLAFTPDGRYLIMGETGLYHNDHPVYIVDAHTMQLLDTVHAPPDVFDLAVAPDSTGFAVATGVGVTVWTFVRH